jgi:hypothetical protein
MKTFKTFLHEEADQFIGHVTSFVNLLSILQKDALIRGNTGFISLTKNANFSKKPTYGISGVGAEIVLKPSILKAAEFEDYEYHNADVEVDTGHEAEIRTSATSLKNIKRYIKYIVLYKNHFPAHPSAKDTMLMNRFMNAGIDDDVDINIVAQYIRDWYHIEVRIK